MPPPDVLAEHVRTVRDEALTELVWAEIADMVDIDAVVRQLVADHPDLADVDEARIRDTFTDDPTRSWRSSAQQLVNERHRRRRRPRRRCPRTTRRTTAPTTTRRRPIVTHNNAGYGKQIIDSGKYAPKTGPLDKLHDRCLHWLGEDYDLDALDAMLAAAAVERLDGDPLWLLIVSGSGDAKTETVQPLGGVGATRRQHHHAPTPRCCRHAANGTRQGRHRRAAAQDRRPRRPRHQGRHRRSCR